MVKRVNVTVIKIIIFPIYDASYYYRGYLYKTNLKGFKTIDMKEISRFLIEWKEMWTYRTRTTIL
ncbi:hypothetical protein Golob_026387, partial [Gossypium lobatum]|nr:hypothetical protein [Gossypium lobatum]